MGLAATTAEPFYLGSPSSRDVPSLWDASLAGRNLMLETPGQSAMFPKGTLRVETAPITRQQFDSGDRPGEASLNPETAWRRTTDSWHKGAGQEFYDRIDSNPFRFEASKGVDPWSDWSLQLQPITTLTDASTETNLRLLAINTRVYLTDGDVLAYYTDVDAATGGTITVTGTPGDWTDITTDGSFVYVTDGANIWRVAWDGSATGAAWSTVDCDRLAFANGRLIGSHDDDLFTLDAAGAATAVTIAATLPAAFAWVGFAEGPSAIYAAGQAGDRATIFRIPIRNDGTGLDVAVPAAVLPDGETVLAIASYLGFVLIGTSQGVRFAAPDADGNLTVGALLETGAACRCFEGQESFVWFGWDNLDASSTGLGRLDLREFAVAGALAPAYASDLMAGAAGAVIQGNVTSVVTFGGRRLFSVAGDGVFVQHATNLVASGWVTSGEINYGVVEPKSAYTVEVLAERYGGGVEVELSTDAGANWDSLGTLTDDEQFNAAGHTSRRFDVRLTLNRTGSTVGPLVTSWTLRTDPVVEPTRLVWVPFLLHEEVDLRPEGQTSAMDVGFELENIQGLNETGQSVTLQIGTKSRQVRVLGHEFRIDRLGPSGGEQGTVLVKCREV